MNKTITTNYNDLSKEELIIEIERLNKEKKCGIVWEDKAEDIIERCKSDYPVLNEINSRYIETNRKDPTNLIIEGDNYCSLFALNSTHVGEIDVIYIDPPYNNGKKDWRYNNDYVDKDDSWMHSKWLSMMNRRLLLSKKLLAPRGVLICAIDHHEQEALGLLLREIFFDYDITCVVIEHNPRGQQGKNFSYCHEYAYFVYPKNIECISKKKKLKNSSNNLRNWGGSSKREDAKNCFYPIYINNNKIISIGEIPPSNFHPGRRTIKRKDGIIEVWPIDNDGIERKWRYAKNTIGDILDQLEIKKKRTKDLDLFNEENFDYNIFLHKDVEKYKTLWRGSKYDSSTYGSYLLNNIIDNTFPYPKSIHIVKECLNSVIEDNPEALVLDFFAGSGTTGHAVLEINKEDKGKRKFILCSNNENNICVDVCYERMKKVMIGYQGIKNKNIYMGLGGNLKYFKANFLIK